MKYENFDDYWLAYLKAHQKPFTRACHYIGTLVGLLGGLLATIFVVWWAWLPVAILGYGVAFASHPLVEGNLPFAKKPLWSLKSDVRMLWLAITGNLEPHLSRLKV